MKSLITRLPFSKIRDRIKTRSEAEKIIKRVGNEFLFLGFMSVWVNISSPSGGKTDIIVTALTAAIFALPGFLLKKRRSSFAAIAMAVISAFSLVVGIIIFAQYKFQAVGLLALSIIIIWSWLLYEALRAYYATKILCNAPLPDISDAPFQEANIVGNKNSYGKYRWKLWCCIALWLVTPLYLAWAIYNFSAGGIGNELGSFVVMYIVAYAIVMGTLKLLKKDYKPAHALGVILLAAILQYSSEHSKLLEAYDAKEFEAELKNATADTYFDIIKSSHTKLGMATSSGINIGQQVSNQLGEIFQGAECPLSLCGEVLKTASIQTKAKRQELLTQIKPRLLNAISAEAKIDAMYQNAFQQFDKINFASANTKSEMLDGFKKTANKLIPLEKNYMQSCRKLYDSIVVLYDYLDKQSPYYYFDNEGKIMFSNQSSLDNYTLYQKAVITAAQEVDASQQILLDEEKEIQSNTTKSLGTLH